MVNISDRINEGLKIRGLKQADLVRLTGIGKSSISSYMSGEYEPKQRNIYKIAEALNVSEAWLMGHDVPMIRVNTINHINDQINHPKLTSDELEFLSIYRNLNAEGKEKAVEYLSDLADMPKYTEKITEKKKNA